jgi:hypothetical protein
MRWLETGKAVWLPLLTAAVPDVIRLPELYADMMPRQMSAGQN